jgi:hypothetical protein
MTCKEFIFYAGKSIKVLSNGALISLRADISNPSKPV